MGKQLRIPMETLEYTAQTTDFQVTNAIHSFVIVICSFYNKTYNPLTDWIISFQREI